jgi:hypothetical protein
MAGIDDVGDDGQAFESQPAHEFEREQAQSSDSEAVR